MKRFTCFIENDEQKSARVSSSLHFLHLPQDEWYAIYIDSCYSSFVGRTVRDFFFLCIKIESLRMKIIILKWLKVKTKWLQETKNKELFSEFFEDELTNKLINSISLYQQPSLLWASSANSTNCFFFLAVSAPRLGLVIHSPPWQSTSLHHSTFTAIWFWPSLIHLAAIFLSSSN